MVDIVLRALFLVKYLSEQCEICLKNLPSKTVLLAADELSSVAKKAKKLVRVQLRWLHLVTTADVCNVYAKMVTQEIVIKSFAGMLNSETIKLRVTVYKIARAFNEAILKKSVLTIQ